MRGSAPRSSYYNVPRAEDPENLRLMRAIDTLYLKRPYFGAPRITRGLRALGYRVNHKRVERLMPRMGLQAVLPGPHTSRPHLEHRSLPYLLRDLEVCHPNEVWCADITYIPMRRGYLYLVAVMDWFSRFVPAWKLSNSMEARFCVEALERALRTDRPKIFNTERPHQALSYRTPAEVHQFTT